MADGALIARCEIDHMKDGPEGPGTYYILTDMDDNVSEPIGPFDDKDAAETAFMTAMEAAAVDVIKKSLGLED